MPIDADIRSRFQRIVASVRRPIDPRCRELLDALVEVGIQRMASDRADASRFGEAEQHLRCILDDMTQQSRILRFDALHEPNLASALERNCPIWPFC